MDSRNNHGASDATYPDAPSGTALPAKKLDSKTSSTHDTALTNATGSPRVAGEDAASVCGVRPTNRATPPTIEKDGQICPTAPGDCVPLAAEASGHTSSTSLSGAALLSEEMNGQPPHKNLSGIPLCVEKGRVNTSSASSGGHTSPAANGRPNPPLNLRPRRSARRGGKRGNGDGQIIVGDGTEHGLSSDISPGRQLHPAPTLAAVASACGRERAGSNCHPRGGASTTEPTALGGGGRRRQGARAGLGGRAHQRRGRRRRPPKFEAEPRRAKVPGGKQAVRGSEGGQHQPIWEDQTQPGNDPESADLCARAARSCWGRMGTAGVKSAWKPTPF